MTIRGRGRPNSDNRDRFTYEVVRWVMSNDIPLGLVGHQESGSNAVSACEVAAWLLCPQFVSPPEAWFRLTIMGAVPKCDQAAKIWHSWSEVNIGWFRYLYGQLGLPAKNWPTPEPGSLNLRLSEATLRRAYQKWQGLDHSTHAYRKTCRHCGHESQFRPTRQERWESQRDRDTCKKCGGSLRNLGGDLSSTS